MATWATDNPTAPLPQAQPDPKPSKRQKATRSQTKALEEHFKHACCVHCGMPYTHRHHIAFRRADNGDDIPVNIAPLCTSCHDLFHSRGSGWERVARSIRVYVLNSRERCVYMKSKMTWDRFNARYPLLNESEGSTDGVLASRRPTGHSDSLSDWEKYERPDERISPWEVDAAQSFEAELSW